MRRRLSTRGAGGLALMAVLALVLPAAALADTLKVGGTGGDLGTMKLLGKAFEDLHPGASVEVLPSLGSSGGVKAALAGAVDIGLTSRPLKEEERKAGARDIAYARTPLVLATSHATRQAGLRSAELIEIFAGVRTTWADGTLIRIVLRPASDSDNKLLVAQIPGMDAAVAKAQKRRGLPVVFTDQEAADRIQSLRGGLGTSSLSVILGEERPLKALALDGVAPTLENLASGSYPMAKTYYFVTGSEPGELARKFIAFVRSEEGAAILRRTGHLVLGADGGQ